MSHKIRLLWGLFVLGALAILAFVSVVILGFVVQTTGVTIAPSPSASAPASSPPPSPKPSGPASATSKPPSLMLFHR